MNNSQIVMGVGIAVVVGALGFFGGMKYQESKAPMFRNGQFAQTFQGGERSGSGQTRMTTRAFGGATMGEITSLDDTSMTVKLQDGSSKIVNLSGSTTYNKAAEGSKSDLKVGDRVAAIGTPSSDGSVTAQSIQINPQMRIMPAGGNGPTGTSPEAK